MSAFNVKLAVQLDSRPDERAWLVDTLWADQAVGIVGGEPKCCKSFLALDLAVAVASGRPALRRFDVRRRGPVLLYAAEDALHVVRARLNGICRAACVAFDDLDVHIIVESSVRLDVDADRTRLHRTIGAIEPILLILDPFVRLHRVDENAASEVAPLLAFLRQLQRGYGLAVLLVHHARKGAAHARAGQALRGSSELHAWGDSNLYLRRHRDQLLLSVEHRAAPPAGPLRVELSGDDDAVALHATEHIGPLDRDDLFIPPTERVLRALADAAHPLSRRALRAACRLRAATAGDAIDALVADGKIVHTVDGYQLADA
ncbi:MAG: AAA family ATPase [Planctomycetota bacterium]|jgi:hypothetical protein